MTAVRLINHSSGWIGGEGWIAFSDNGGTEWEVQAQPKGTVRQIFALNGKQAWTVMENNDLYRTTDGGETWIRIGSTPNAGFLHFISPETGFSGQAKTEDGAKPGATWIYRIRPPAVLSLELSPMKLPELPRTKRMRQDRCMLLTRNPITDS